MTDVPPSSNSREMACAACDRSLTVTMDQIDQSIRCPSCNTVMLLRREGSPCQNPLVTCPGCRSKLMVPDNVKAKAYRCPKCTQHLAPP